MVLGTHGGSVRARALACKGASTSAAAMPAPVSLTSSERDEVSARPWTDDPVVTVPGLAATASNSDPAAALAVIGALVLGMGVLIGLGIRIVLKDRRALRFCPRCGADAIAEAAVEVVDVIQVRAAVRCGQCGTWRRVMTTRAEQEAHAHRLDLHRRYIREGVGRLDAERSADEIDAFIALLRSDIAGAEDFLARTRAYPQSILP
jgi:hypothetical protein